MSNLISCNLMGGLGNQMFQAGHALAQGWKHNRETVFIPRSWTPMQGRETFHYRENIFRNLINLIIYHKLPNKSIFIIFENV